jgi:uncharacterized protein (TIGR03086 family)
MTQQAMPNPIEVYEAAVKQARKTMAAVKPSQLAQPTPCSYWTVQGLMAHMVGAAEWLPTFFQAGTPPQPGLVAREASLAAYETAVSRGLQTARAPGALEKKAQTPMGELTGAQALFAISMDTCIHSWDLAKATGQETKLDPKLAEVAYGMVKAMADTGRKMGAFGPEVAVPANASLQDKMLGLTGRKP